VEGWQYPILCLEGLGKTMMNLSQGQVRCITTSGKLHYHDSQQNKRGYIFRLVVIPNMFSKKMQKTAQLSSTQGSRILMQARTFSERSYRFHEVVKYIFIHHMVVLPDTISSAAHCPPTCSCLVVIILQQR
jgi:hypothetical protein